LGAYSQTGKLRHNFSDVTNSLGCHL
jgi:hypothetical protein